jgi:hypothetical protein
MIKKEFPAITKAYYVQSYERGEVKLKVEIEGQKPMVFYPEGLKSALLEEGVVPKILTNDDYEYEYDYGEPIPDSELGLSGPATKHPGLVRVLRRFFDDTYFNTNIPGTDITEEATKEDSAPWVAPRYRR